MKAARPRDAINSRKVEHLAVFDRDADVDRRRHHFDEIHLTHRALPELSLRDIDTSTVFLGKRIRFPLIISSMTGGDHAALRTINRRLAEAAEAEQVAMGVGSQRVQFANAGARASFAIRRYAPTVPLCANLGAVQLNLGFGLHEAQEAVATLQADALYLHLNPLQEAVQPEGETDFRHLARRIGDLANKLRVPVLVKEVGAGLSRADAELLVRRGIRHLDVAGSGGTSWSRVEAQRAAAQKDRDLGLCFQDWGLPTPWALHELNALRRQGVYLIASGGIRTGIDMAKAVVLGASLCGVAAPLLAAARVSTKAVRTEIARLHREFVTAMFLLGQASVRKMVGGADLIRAAPWK